MSSDCPALIPLCTSHEIRRDFSDLVAAAEPLRPADQSRALWSSLPEVPLDVLWARARPPEIETLVEHLHSYASRARRLVLLAESACREVARELPSGDRLGRNLRRLLEGETLASGENLLLGFDDARRPCIGWIGEHTETLALLERVRLLADQTVPVLLSGETGTGKEVIARALHVLGRRAPLPFLATNCAELPESLLESELFGHTRGAFTGAVLDRAGLFEAAGAGTVFLDEIAELPLSAQAKLLRVLEEHRVRPLGTSHSRALACRIVAATNRHLLEETRKGRFRADLFYRLRGAEIALPAMRNRPNDVLPLAEFFRARASLRFRRPTAGFSEAAKLALLSYSWFGNVRELRHVVEAAVLAAEGEWVRPEALGLLREATVPPGEAPVLTVSAAERDHILRALASTAGNKVAAARLLGITRQSLQRRIVRHGIQSPAGNDASRPAEMPENERPPRTTTTRFRGI
jgi:transcriptional regulator with PAS, ATPase and Fis domain